MARPRKAPAPYEAITRDELASRLRQLEMALAQLEESRARLSDLYDFAPVVYLTLDPQSRIVEANLSAAALFGVERGNLLGKFLTTLVANADRRALREHIRRCLHERIRVENELTFSLRRQPPVLARVASVPSFDADGKVTAVKTTLTDVTAFRRAHEKLQFLVQASATLGSSFDYHATLVQVARQAVPVLGDICIVDLVDAGGALRRLEVAFADPARAAELASFLSVPARSDHGTAVGKALRTKEALLVAECSPASLASTADGFDHEILIKVSGARSMMVAPMVARDTVHGVITLIAAASGRRYSALSLATARDLAARAALAIDNARLYERAQQAIRAREDVLSFVSHDLRNPLMGIQLTTETVLRGVRGDERRKGWKQIERIRRGALQMRHMIDDLLDVASIDMGRLTIAPGVEDVGRLFDDTAAMLAPVAADKAIALRFDLPASGLFIRCDRERIVQVLSNLVGNSLKFTPEGGSIVVTGRAVDGKAVIAVSDTGPGISPALRPHIFERFWQAEDDTRKGRGLGLYIVKGLIDAHGEAIWVDSPPQGGTMFSFTLSLASAAEVDSFRKTIETTRGTLGHDPLVDPR